ncbi:U5 small nuclear ribonucleoprotein helicase [Euphorbia peplus]|nr:U5 small nuclear ribonucleoprotein helicase [Euphorbia peplus]
MEDDEMGELLQMSDPQLIDIVRFCNRFPNIDMSYEVVDDKHVRVGEDITLVVTLKRDLERRTEVGPVDALRYPKAKEEGLVAYGWEHKEQSVTCNQEGFSAEEVNSEAGVCCPFGPRKEVVYFVF